MVPNQMEKRDYDPYLIKFNKVGSKINSLTRLWKEITILSNNNLIKLLFNYF